MYCSNCKKNTPHKEDSDDTGIKVWHCLYCGNTRRGGTGEWAVGSFKDKPIKPDPDGVAMDVPKEKVKEFANV